MNLYVRFAIIVAVVVAICFTVVVMATLRLDATQAGTATYVGMILVATLGATLSIVINIVYWLQKSGVS